jgi:hypothetical protein
MQPLPTADLRSNQGTWIVPGHRIPVVTAVMLDSLPAEAYDRAFQGQRLRTVYFDDADYTLRKARAAKGRYLTLRVRCYEPPGQPEVYAVSAKTESEKWRVEIAPALAHGILGGTADLAGQLPAYLAARLSELDAGALVPVVRVGCTRFAVEDDTDRITLDLCVDTDRAARLPFGVLEYKSRRPDPLYERIARLRLAPVKLSKFLWATEV